MDHLINVAETATVTHSECQIYLEILFSIFLEAKTTLYGAKKEKKQKKQAHWDMMKWIVNFIEKNKEKWEY